jgi:hypothetical protein
MEMKRIYCFLAGAAFTLALTACGNDQEQASAPAPAAENQTVAETPAAPAPASQGPVKGKVLETMDASGYTYIRLDDGSGTELWAAAPKTQLEIGEEISLQGGSVMNNFSSKSLERTFESIIFASGVVRAGDEQVVAGPGEGGSFASAVEGEGAAGSAGSAGNVVPFAELSIEKATAENGITVGDLFAQAATLDTQKVTIKGQVVKVSKNIMGKNWLHLQDGTGDPNSNTHDLVVTTDGIAEKGAIVTIEGVLSANKDFGSGYKYDAIVEEGAVLE